MKIVFYSTSAVKIPEEVSPSKNFPTLGEQWIKLKEKYPEDEWVIMAHKSPYIADGVDNVLFDSENPKYIEMEKTLSPDEIARMIAEENPDIAVAINTPTSIGDWNFLNDSVIAEKLEEMGIKTYANTAYASLAFADKFRSRLFFRSKTIPSAPGLYINSTMFWADEDNPDKIAFSPYKNYIEHRLDSFNYPIIIKETFGSGGSDARVVHSPEEAKQILRKRKVRTDFIIEELLQGELFGAELYGAGGNYKILPPVKLSVNEEGVSEATTNVKFGPVQDERYNLEKLYKMLDSLAKDLSVSGSVQVDLMFKDGEWYVLEVNPRLSGMSQTTAVMEGKSVFERFTDIAYNNFKKDSEFNYVLNFKPIGMTDEKIEKMRQWDHVRHILHVPPYYSEVVLGGFDQPQQIIDELKELKKQFPDNIPNRLIETTKSLIES